MSNNVKEGSKQSLTMRKGNKMPIQEEMMKNKVGMGKHSRIKEENMQVDTGRKVYQW